MILVFLFILATCVFAGDAWGDWASPNVISVVKNFSYNGVEYSVKYLTSMNQSKAYSYLSRVMSNPAMRKVAVPIRLAPGVGWIMTVASVGYVIYDLSQPVADLRTQTQTQTWRCGDHTFELTFQEPTSGIYCYDSVDFNGVWNFHQIMYPSQTRYWGVFRKDGGDPVSGFVFCKPFAVTCYGLPAQEITTVSDVAIRDYVENNPDVFTQDVLNPQFSYEKPSDAIEVESDPDGQVVIQQDRQQEEPSNEEEAIPDTSENTYIDPGVPAQPEFFVNDVVVPEKKNLRDVLDRWLSTIPFLTFFSDLGIAGTGNCSINVPFSFNGASGMGVLDFCQYSELFDIIGSIIVSFSGIYAVYIIFKRSD